MSLIYQPHEWSSVHGQISIGGILSYSVDVFAHFDFVLNCARELASDTSPDDDGINHIRLRDCDDVCSQLKEINKGVALLEAAMCRGDRCLVTCAAGRNRSSLVVALTLVKAGYAPELVVRRIQERREHSLTNETFRAYILAC